MNNRPAIKTLIFDLTGVLFTFDQWQIFKLIGLWDVITYVLTHFKNPFIASLELAQVIAQREEPNDLPPVFYKEYLMPSCIALALLGKLSAQQTNIRFREQIQELIEAGHLKNRLEIKIMHFLADVMSDTQTRAIIMPPNYLLINLIKEMQQQYKVQTLMLSNLDAETYKALLGLYPEVFELFDGVVISAEVGMIKPNADIFEYTINTYNLDPSTCVFVDDQQENIASAQELGIRSILYTNTRSLKRQLATIKFKG